MRSFEFCIPVSFQELEQHDRLSQPEYSPDEIVSGGLLEDCGQCLSEDGSFSVESCFPVYYHLFRLFTQIPDHVRHNYWTVLTNGISGLTRRLESHDLPQLSPDEKGQLRNKVKMCVYLLVQWLEVNEHGTTTGKNQPLIGWKAGREQSIELLHSLMVIHLPSLWDPPSVAMMDDLAALVGTGCYKILENTSVARERGLLDKTIHLLGILVRDYAQGLSFSVKVTQLLQHFDHLAGPLSQAVVRLVNDFGSKSIVSEIVRELGAKDPIDLAADASGTRNFATFLTELGQSVPGLVLPLVSVLMPHLLGESYTFRIGVLSVVGSLLLHLSKVQGETPMANSPRDQLLDKLMEHIHDINAFVRVKVILTIQQLISSQAIPLHSLQEAVDLVCDRLTDKSISVRKSALQLLTTSVTCNPFAAKLEMEIFKTKLETEEKMLQRLIEQNIASEDDGGGETRELTKQLAIVNYLRNARKFLDTLCEHIPVVVQMLGSKVTSDIQEAINFLSTCASFGIAPAHDGVQRSLGLVWSGDPAVRKAVLDVHVKLYLNSDLQESGDHGAALTAGNLIALVKRSNRGQLASLEKLMGMFVKGDLITAPVIKCLWDSFQQRTAESALAVQVLSMAASAQPDIISNNFDLLVAVGLSSDPHIDLVLAEHTCAALRKVSPQSLSDGSLLPMDHPLLALLQQILEEHFTNLSTSRWAPLAEQAIGCVYQLCVSPTSFCQAFLVAATELTFPKESVSDSVNSALLCRLLFAVGLVAHRQMLYIELTIHKELKRRAQRDESKKESTEKDTQELTLAGASGEDPVTELVRKVLEKELGGEDRLLATYEPLIVEILSNPTKYPCPELSNSAALALAKYMLVSPTLCEKHVRLFFTILEKSKLDSVRANSVITASDLACKFPNIIEPWTPYLYARLMDTSIHVRRNTLTVLTHLILNDMIKVRGQISSMALCIVDQDPKISDLAKHFFHELAAKGNTLYNVIPDIVSTLSGGPTENSVFHSVVKYIFGLIQKDKQCENLIEKLCHRFRAARSDRQARDLAHCMNHLTISDKSVRRLQDNFPCYKDWLVDTVIHDSFTLLLTKAKKFTKPEVKGQIEELERMMNEAHVKGTGDSKPSMDTAECDSKPSMDTAECDSKPSMDTTECGSIESNTVPEGGTPDDFTTDVLSSARKSLVRATPRSQVQKGHRRIHYSLSDEESSEEDKPNPTKLQLSSGED